VERSGSGAMSLVWSQASFAKAMNTATLQSAAATEERCASEKITTLYTLLIASRRSGA